MQRQSDHLRLTYTVSFSKLLIAFAILLLALFQYARAQNMMDSDLKEMLWTFAFAWGWLGIGNVIVTIVMFPGLVRRGLLKGEDA